MKVILFGATGKTGMHLWRQALDRGHEVTAFTRSAGKIATDLPGLRVDQGDVTDPAAVSNSVAGHDAAIIALGSNGLGDKTTLTTGTENVICGMTQHQVRRLIVLSAAGVGESWKQTPWLARIMFRTMLRNIYADHAAQEGLVTASELDWTVVRAAILKDDPATGQFTASNKGKVRDINREDLAHFLVQQVDDHAYSEQAISVTA